MACHRDKRVYLPFELILLGLVIVGPGCGREAAGPPVLHWYTFNEPSGAFAEAARRCSKASGGAYSIELAHLPASADQQREQLVRRLAAGDEDIDLIALDVIWTPEFATAGWILPWPQESARSAVEGRLGIAVETARHDGRLWAAPFTSNAQLLWYRSDRVERPPSTWEDMVDAAERIGGTGTILAQGERYEGLTVLFTSLLASAGGSVLDESGTKPSLAAGPTRAALEIMKRYATSDAAPASLATMREDEARRAYETGEASFMVNYTFVWPSALRNAPEIAERTGWARWPSAVEGRPSRVTVGGINVGVGAHTRHRGFAFEAAACLVSERNQRTAAVEGGLLPTTVALYDDAEVRERFPFADTVRSALYDAVQRPETPLYTDVSLAIVRTLHPMREIEPEADAERLREEVGRALRSEGLL